MNTPARKAFLVKHEVSIKQIAVALAVDRSAVSHTLSGRRRNPDLQRGIVDYLRRRLNKKVPNIFG